MPNWWLTDLWESDPIQAVSWVMWVIVSITLHELGHGWAALRAGDRTPIDTGHMTWNPLVHMGPFSLIMFALVGIAWGLMPVNPSNFRKKSDNAIVAFAGPAMNLSLWLTCVVLLCLWSAVAYGHWFGGAAAGAIPDRIKDAMVTALAMGAMLNMVLFIFNLMPVPPLDGSRILATWSPAYERLWQFDHARFVALVLFVLAFRYAGGVIFPAAETVTAEVVRAIMRVIT